MGAVPNPLKHGASLHYQRTYLDHVQCGPSGPTRHANILAILAGLCTPAMREIILRDVLANPAVEPIAPGFDAIRLQPVRPSPWPIAFRATLPTPHGAIDVECEDANGELQVHLPRAISIICPIPKGVVTESRQ